MPSCMLPEDSLRFVVKVDTEKCKGCALCVEVCPKDVLQMGHAVNSMGWLYAETPGSDKCTGCKMCAIICPDAVIRITKEGD